MHFAAKLSVFLLLLASCKTEPPTDRKRFAQETLRLAWTALKDKINRTVPEYAAGKDGADVIARAIINMCEHQVQEVVTCAVERDMLSFSKRESLRQSTMQAYRQTNDESVRREATDYTIALIIKSRGELDQGRKGY